VAKRLLQEAEQNFEPLHGKTPVLVLDEHPNGELMALQVLAQDERAAIWSTQTRKLVWEPQDVNALCWTPDGNDILLVQELYQRDPQKHRIISTPLQSECYHVLERRSWPDRHLVGRCAITPPRGWITDLLVAPTGEIACYVWNDQHEAGMELLSIAVGRIHQLEGRGYQGKQSNLLEGPAFSPDGRYLVLTYTTYAWWSPDDPETPSLGGQCNVGLVVVGDMTSGSYRVCKVNKPVPGGWLPPEPNDFCYRCLSRPHFLDADHFVVMLPTGERRSFSISEVFQ
jgi:hypothetical protein